MKSTPGRSPFPLLESIAALVVVAGFGGLAYLQMQQAAATPPIDTQSTYDSDAGGYLALYEVLQREGVRAERFERHAAYLDDSIDVYVVSDAGQAQNQVTGGLAGADIESTAAWVRAGNRLVVIGENYDSEAAWNMAQFDRSGTAHDRARPILKTSLVAGVRTVEGTSKNRIQFTHGQNQTPVIADRTGAVVAAYQLGKGAVVIVTDPTLFQNRNLAHADNARLAYDLVTAGLRPNAIVAFDEFSHGHQVGDSLWSVLPRPVQAGLAILCAALLALLVSTVFRFGPVARPPVDGERTSAEYLWSMATLLARGGATRKALRDVADAAIHDLAASLGLHDGAPVALLATRLHGRAGGDALGHSLLELNRLRSYEYPKEADLLAAARIAATLRKEYAPNARIGFGRRRSPSKRSA